MEKRIDIVGARGCWSVKVDWKRHSDFIKRLSDAKKIARSIGGMIYVNSIPEAEVPKRNPVSGRAIRWA